jgi:uncharacterized protein
MRPASKVRTFLILLAAIAFSIATAALADQPRFPKAIGSVNDFAEVLTQGQRAQIEDYLKGIEARGGIEIVLATLPTIGDLTIEEAATRLYEQWGIGKKGTNQGILLDAIEQRRIRSR